MREVVDLTLSFHRRNYIGGVVPQLGGFDVSPGALRWRTDNPAKEADTLANLQSMLMPAHDEAARRS